MSKNTYQFLKDLVKGDSEYSRWNIPDDLIYDIHFNEKNPISSQVILDFKNDDAFLETLGVDEHDIYEYIHIMYYDSSSYDYYRYDDEWKEGYIVSSFNNENREKYELILKLTMSSDITRDYVLMKKLMDLFPRQIDDIIAIYADENERCIYDAAKEVVKKETEKPFDRFGIIEVWHGSRFKTTIGILLNWYRMLKAEDEDITELLTRLFNKYNPKSDIGNWDEVRYNSFCDDYDQQYVQEQIGKELDNIIEEIEEEGISDEFQKLYDVVLKLGGFNKLIELEKKKISIIFKSIDPHTGLLTFTLWKNDNPENRSVDNLEDLYLNLYHPELFESVKDILNRIL